MSDKHRILVFDGDPLPEIEAKWGDQCPIILWGSPNLCAKSDALRDILKTVEREGHYLAATGGTMADRDPSAAVLAYYGIRPEEAEHVPMVSPLVVGLNWYYYRARVWLNGCIEHGWGPAWTPSVVAYRCKMRPSANLSDHFEEGASHAVGSVS